MTSSQDVSREEKVQRVVNQLANIGINDPTVSSTATIIESGVSKDFTKIYCGSFDDDKKAAEEHRETVRDAISTGSVSIKSITPNSHFNGVTHNIVTVKVFERLTSDE